jgi:hypothetical protein
VSTVAVVTTVILVFFLVGVLVGVAVVYALSVRRTNRAEHRTDPDDLNGPPGGSRGADTRWPF